MNEKINDDYDRLSRAEESVREAFSKMREGILTELNTIETGDTTRQVAAAGGRILDYQNKMIEDLITETRNMLKHEIQDIDRDG